MATGASIHEGGVATARLCVHISSMCDQQPGDKKNRFIFFLTKSLWGIPGII